MRSSDRKKPFTVYCISNMVTGFKYVGQTDNFNRRVYHHKNLLDRGKHDSPLFQKDFNSFGWSSFVTGILHQTDCRERARNAEKKLIEKMRPLYNKSYLSMWVHRQEVRKLFKYFKK